MSRVIDLVRRDLSALIADATSAHPGLLIQRGLDKTESARQDANREGTDAEPGASAKQKHIERICKIPASPFYAQAYARWLATTGDPARFCSAVLKIDGRLLIGLSGGASLETACAVSHTYGTPYIPGSSIKGVARAHAASVLQRDDRVIDDLFGAPADEQHRDGLAGLVTFHDAWWVPDSAPHNHPFVQDIVTSHHSLYYASDGKTPATDLDSPIPNALIAVQGSFLIVLEGAAAWTGLAKSIVEQALGSNGAGAKTRSGYGYMSVDAKAQSKLDEVRAARRERDEAAGRKAEQEAAWLKALEAMTPLQREVAEYLHKRPNKNDAEIPVLFAALRTNVWQGETKQQIAAMLKERLVAAGKWRLHSNAKKVEKDYPYQETQQVLRWLEGKD